MRPPLPTPAVFEIPAACTRPILGGLSPDCPELDCPRATLLVRHHAGRSSAPSQTWIQGLPCLAVQLLLWACFCFHEVGLRPRTEGCRGARSSQPSVRV